MGDLDLDTRVEAVAEDTYRATLSEDWNIWGPNGGYLAAVLLRAAAAATELPRPASLAVQFLGRAAFEPVDLEIRRLRRTRRAEALGVSMRQHGKAIAEALAWFVADDVPGLEHDVTTMPDVARPDDLRTLGRARRRPWHRRHRSRSGTTSSTGPASGSRTGRRPVRCRPGPTPGSASAPTATFDDPVVDACRSVVILDTMGWPATTMAHCLGVADRRAAAVDGAEPGPPRPVPPGRARQRRAVLPVRRPRSPTRGSITAEGRLWAADGTLLASAGAQLLCTPVAAPAERRGVRYW